VKKPDSKQKANVFVLLFLDLPGIRGLNNVKTVLNIIPYCFRRCTMLSQRSARGACRYNILIKRGKKKEPKQPIAPAARRGKMRRQIAENTARYNVEARSVVAHYIYIDT